MSHVPTPGELGRIREQVARYECYGWPGPDAGELEHKRQHVKELKDQLAELEADIDAVEDEIQCLADPAKFKTRVRTELYDRLARAEKVLLAQVTSGGDR